MKKYIHQAESVLEKLWTKAKEIGIASCFPMRKHSKIQTAKTRVPSCSYYPQMKPHYYESLCSSSFISSAFKLQDCEYFTWHEQAWDNLGFEAL